MPEMGTEMLVVVGVPKPRRSDWSNRVVIPEKTSAKWTRIRCVVCGRVLNIAEKLWFWKSPGLIFYPSSVLGELTTVFMQVFVDFRLFRGGELMRSGFRPNCVGEENFRLLENGVHVAVAAKWKKFPSAAITANFEWTWGRFVVRSKNINKCIFRVFFLRIWLGFSVIPPLELRFLGVV